MAFPKWYTDMPGWKRVLYDWKAHYHRTGLTIQSVASIAERDAKKVLAEMKADPETYVQWCGVIQAPVWSTKSGGAVIGTLESPDHLVRLTYWSLNYFAPPEFKSLRRMKGETTWMLAQGDGSNDAAMVTRLRSVYKGTAYAKADDW